MNLIRVIVLFVGVWAVSLAPGRAQGPAGGKGTPLGAEERARQIASRWIDVLGGADRIRALSSVYYSGTLRLGDESAPVELQVRATRQGHYRYDYQLPTHGQLTQAYDGRSAWQKNENLGFGPQSLTEHQANLAGVDLRGPIGQWSRFSLRRAVADEVIDGRVHHVIEVGADNKVVEKWYFDAETGFRTRVTGQSTEGVAESVDFSDYRRVSNGMREPFKTVRRVGGRVLTVTLTAVFYNEEIDPALFAPPMSWVEKNQAIELILGRNHSMAGLSQLNAVETRITEAMQEVTTSGLKIPTKIYQKRPNFYLLEQEVAGMGPSLQGFDGRIGWAWNELQGFRTMEGAELAQMLASADFDMAARLGALCPLRKLLDDVEEGDRRLVGVAFASLQGVAGNFYYDAATHDLVRVETFVQAGPSGRLKVTADFSDFRRVDGLRLPFVTTLNNPAMRIVTTVQSVRHNEPIDDARFAPKKDVD